MASRGLQRLKKAFKKLLHRRQKTRQDKPPKGKEVSKETCTDEAVVQSPPPHAAQDAADSQRPPLNETDPAYADLIGLGSSQNAYENLVHDAGIFRRCPNFDRSPRTSGEVISGRDTAFQDSFLRESIDEAEVLSFSHLDIPPPTGLRSIARYYDEPWPVLGHAETEQSSRRR